MNTFPYDPSPIIPRKSKLSTLTRFSSLSFLTCLCCRLADALSSSMVLNFTSSGLRAVYFRKFTVDVLSILSCIFFSKSKADGVVLPSSFISVFIRVDITC